MGVVLTKSKKPGEKFDAVINGKKTVSFGDSDYSDYTKHKDVVRKEAYIARHNKCKSWVEWCENCGILVG